MKSLNLFNLLCLLIKVTADAITKSSYSTFDLNEENVMDVLREFYEKPKDTLPLMVNLVVGECTEGECPEFYKVLNLASDIVKLQNRIAIVSCGGDRDVCDILPKYKPINNIVSLYIRDNKIFGYEGEQTQDGILDLMSADAWLEQEELVGDFNKYFEEVTGEARPIGERLWK